MTATTQVRLLVGTYVHITALQALRSETKSTSSMNSSGQQVFVSMLRADPEANMLQSSAWVHDDALHETGSILRRRAHSSDNRVDYYMPVKSSLAVFFKKQMTS